MHKIGSQLAVAPHSFFFFFLLMNQWHLILCAEVGGFTFILYLFNLTIILEDFLFV